MDPVIMQVLVAAHLGVVVPYAVVAVMLCSALDASLPQPAAGSHWLPLRKLVSFVALNFANAKNGAQPPVSSWLLRVLQPLLTAQLAKQAAQQTLPEPAPAPAAAPAAPAQPTPTAA